MLRRDLLKGAAAGITTLAAPGIGRAEGADKLVFVPTEDLNVLDPVVGGPARRAITTRSTASTRTGRPSLRWSRDIRSTRTG